MVNFTTFATCEREATRANPTPVRFRPSVHLNDWHSAWIALDVFLDKQRGTANLFGQLVPYPVERVRYASLISSTGVESITRVATGSREEKGVEGVDAPVGGGWPWPLEGHPHNLG